MIEKEQNSKIIWNAISAYFMIFVSGLFLLNKQDALLNNNFVKTHTKSALMIHIGFFITYFTFISYGIWNSIFIGSFALNYILTSLSCIFLLGMLLFWIFTASKWEIFSLWDIIKFSKIQRVLEVENQRTQLEERDKLDILFSYIPFISFYIAAKHTNNSYIVHGSRGTLFLTVILILLYNFHHTDIVLFLILIYLIYIVFIGLNLFTTGNILQIRYSKIFSPEYKFLYTRALYRYLKNYISWQQLQTISHYQQEIIEENKIINLKDNEKLLTLPDLKFPKVLIYIPIFNLLYIFIKENKYSSHIRNGVVISILFLISFLILKFSALSYGFLYLFWIISLYWIGNIHTKPVYKMPYIYMFYTALMKIRGKTKEANAKYNVEKNVTLKVEEK
mgnify:CR=1 FL=1